MKIFMVSKPVCPPWDDSGKNIVRDITNNVKKHKFYVITKKYFTFSKDNIEEIRIFEKGFGYQPNLYQKLRLFLRLLKKDDVDVYHFFFTPNKITSNFSKFLSKIKNKKTIQSINSLPKNKDFKKQIFANNVIVLSDYSKSLLEKQNIKNIKRIYPGVNYKKVDSKNLKEFLGITNEFIVLYPGDLETLINLNQIIRIIKSTTSKNKNIKFIFACRLKTEGSIRIQNKLKQLVKKYSLEEHCIFINKVNMLELLNLSHVIFFPIESTFKKMDIPLVLIEALSYSKPIIISNIKPLNEIMKDDIGFTSDFSDSILKLSKNKKLYKKLSKNSKKVFNENFNMKKIAKEYEKFYSKLK